MVSNQTWPFNQFPLAPKSSSSPSLSKENLIPIYIVAYIMFRLGHDRSGGIY